MENTELASFLSLVLPPLSGMVVPAVITGLPLSADTIQPFYNFSIKSLESRCMGMHMMVFEGYPLSSQWYVYLKDFFVVMYFSKVSNLFLLVLLNSLKKISF